MNPEVIKDLQDYYERNGRLTPKQMLWITRAYPGGMEAFMKTVTIAVEAEEQNDDGVKEMSDLNLLLAEQNENFKIVKVTFPTNGKQYTYKTVLDLEEGDNVIVDSPNNGFVVVEVGEVIPAIETNLDFGFNVKWIVSKVDTEQYEACIDMERQATKTLNQLKYSRRRKELIKDLEDVVGADGLNNVKQLIKL